MELKKLKEQLTGIWGKYRYAIGILVLGLLLMLIPGKENTGQETKSESVPSAQVMTAEEQLAKILSAVKGAGKVEVLLSYASGERTIYQTDTNSTAEADRSDTVIVTDENRKETGLITQVDPPAFLGAIIVCQGADDPTVRLAIVDAVSKYTGLSVNKISVLKMK